MQRLVNYNRYSTSLPNPNPAEGILKVETDFNVFPAVRGLQLDLSTEHGSVTCCPVHFTQYASVSLYQTKDGNLSIRERATFINQDSHNQAHHANPRHKGPDGPVCRAVVQMRTDTPMILPTYKLQLQKRPRIVGGPAAASWAW